MIKAAVASANAAPASNNDDLQQEMQRIFRPEKLMAQFKAYLSSTATDYYKGQLISECLFDNLKFSTKTNEKFDIFLS